MHNKKKVHQADASKNVHFDMIAQFNLKKKKLKISKENDQLYLLGFYHFSWFTELKMFNLAEKNYKTQL